MRYGGDNLICNVNMPTIPCHNRVPRPIVFLLRKLSLQNHTVILNGKEAGPFTSPFRDKQAIVLLAIADGVRRCAFLEKGDLSMSHKQVLIQQLPNGSVRQTFQQDQGRFVVNPDGFQRAVRLALCTAYPIVVLPWLTKAMYSSSRTSSMGSAP